MYFTQAFPIMNLLVNTKCDRCLGARTVALYCNSNFAVEKDCTALFVCTF